jgi:hypothetical protein
VRSRAARERQTAAGHARPESRDARQIAGDADVLLAGAGDLEQLAHGRAAVAEPELEPLDLGPAQAGEPVGGQHLGVQRRDGRLAQGQRERHGTSSRRWK